MVRSGMIWSVLGLCLVLSGCQNSTSTTKPAESQESVPGTTSTEAGGPAKPAGGGPAEKPKLTVLEGVDTFEGTWCLSVSMQLASRHAWLFRLSKDEQGQWSLQEMSTQSIFGTLSGSEVKISGSQISLSAAMENTNAQIKNAKISFEGELRDGIVFGNILLGDTGPIPARLLPTDAQNLTEYADIMLEEGTPEFEKASREPDPAHGMWNVAKKYPKASFTLDIYKSLLVQLDKWNLTDDEVQKMKTDFLEATELWGRRLQGPLEVDVGINVAKRRKYVQIADDLLTAGESHLEKRTPEIDMVLKLGRTHLRIARGIAALRGKDAEAAQQAFQDLEVLATEQIYIPELVLELAQYADRTKQTDSAIKYNLILAGLPTLAQLALSTQIGVQSNDQAPAEMLKVAWKEKHGSLDGLEAALAETYDQEIKSFFDKLKAAAPALPAADSGNRAVLIELFTGSACAPCVALDLALAEIRRDLPISRVIQLSYHQHLPAPDPLTSLDGEGRGKYYDIQGTPAMFANGAPINQIGGQFLPVFLEQNYMICHAVLSAFMKQSTEVKIESSAVVEAGKLHVKISVTGVPEEMLSKARLRIAIAEEKVEFQAANGVRHHHMVVRTMLGGTGGKAPNKDQQLEYSITMPLGEIKARQVSYMAQVEHARRVEFPVKPAELKPLYVVAFVQNDTTREILQAVATPVEGELVYPDFNLKANGEISVEKNSATPVTEPEKKADPAPETSPPDATKPETDQK